MKLHWSVILILVIIIIVMSIPWIGSGVLLGWLVEITFNVEVNYAVIIGISLLFYSFRAIKVIPRTISAARRGKTNRKLMSKR